MPTNHPKSSGLTLSAAIFTICEREGGPSKQPKAVGATFAMTDSTGENIIAGTWDDRMAELGQSIDRPHGEALLMALFAQSSKYVYMPVADGDVNNNGVVDMSDLSDGGIASLEKATGLVRGVHDCGGVKCLTPVQAANIVDAAKQAITVLSHVVAAASKLTLSGGAMRVA